MDTELFPTRKRATSVFPGSSENRVAEMKVRLLLLLMFIAWSAAGYAQTRSPVSGWLHTSGGKIFDSSGHLIRLTGIMSTGMEWGAGHP